MATTRAELTEPVRASASGPTGPVRFDGLEGMRGLAALAVVAFHAGYFSLFSLKDNVLTPFMEQLGGWGVTIFFLLSGFLLYRPFVVADLDGTRVPKWRSFYLRRALRIFPAYWVALFSFIVIFRPPLALHNAYDVVTYFGLIQTYRPAYGLQGLSVAWTLCVEVSFYAVLPVLAWAIRRVTKRHQGASAVRTHLACIGVLYLSALAFRWYMITVNDSTSLRELLWLPNYLDYFALGMALAVASAWQERGGTLPDVLQRLIASPAACWLLGLQFFWLTTQLNLPIVPDLAPYMAALFFNGVGAAMLLLPAIFNREKTIIGRFLTTRPLLFAGKISYGIYLWHLIWLDVVLGWLSDRGLADSFPALFVALLVPTVITATLSFYFIEAPARRLAGGARARWA